MCLWSFVHREVCSWIFFIEVICGDSNCEEFYILGDFFLMIQILFFEIFPLWRFIQCSSRGLKNCFSLLVLRLKIFVLVIWLRVIGLGLDFKMDANSRLKLGILINSGCEVWNDFLTLVVYLGWLFGTIELILLFLNVSLKFRVWWLLCDHGYDWVCLIEMGMAKLDWFCWNFATFEANDPFFLKNFVLLIFLSLVD